MKKNIARKLFCPVFVMAALSLIVFSGCGNGGSSDCADPVLDSTGTWCISITYSHSTCGLGPDKPLPYEADYTQSDNKVSATANGGTYSGTICGGEATLTGSNFGFHTTINITFSDDSHGSGTTKYSSDTCSGTDRFDAVKGLCP